MHEASKGQESHIIVRIPVDTAARREPGFSFPSNTLHLATYVWSSAGIQAQSDTPFLQNNNNKPKSNLTTETTPIGVTNVRGPSLASFPTVLFITFPSLTYSPQLLLPSPLLSSRHEIDTPGSTFCANSPPAATADFTNDGEMARRAKG